MLAMIPTASRPPRRVSYAGLLLPVAILVGCRRSETARAGNPENPQTWAPERLTSVEGVPASEIEAQIKTKLAAARPPKIDDDQWGHTRRLYKLYGENPLWLSPDGLHKTRTKALTDAILGADADGMRMDDCCKGRLATRARYLEERQAWSLRESRSADGNSKQARR